MVNDNEQINSRKSTNKTEELEILHKFISRLFIRADIALITFKFFIKTVNGQVSEASFNTGPILTSEAVA